MSQTIRDVMTFDPVSVSESTTLQEVARIMREQDIGDVIVEREGRAAGIVTDRDIVVRAIAQGEDPSAVQAGDICSGDMLSLAPTDSVESAVSIMRDAAVRRVPVLEEGRAVGIVSLGDLARTQDPSSALSDISTEPPNE
jgi:CBS domain-containing protein